MCVEVNMRKVNVVVTLGWQWSLVYPVVTKPSGSRQW